MTDVFRISPTGEVVIVDQTGVQKNVPRLPRPSLRIAPPKGIDPRGAFTTGVNRVSSPMYVGKSPFVGIQGMMEFNANAGRVGGASPIEVPGLDKAINEQKFKINFQSQAQRSGTKAKTTKADFPAPERKRRKDKLKKWGIRGGLGGLGLLGMMASEPAPKDYKTAIQTPLDIFITGGNALSNRLEAAAKDPNSSQAMSDLNNILAGIAGAPADMLYGMEELVKDPSKLVPESLQNYFMKPQAEVEKIRNEQEQEQNLQQIETQQLLQEFYQPEDSKATPTMNEFSLGDVQFGESPQIPLPPPSVDYSEVLQALENTMPEPPDQGDTGMNRAMSALAGMMSGLISVQNGEPLGRAILKMGVGGLGGMAINDKQVKQVEAEFKNKMDDYWRRVAKVKQAMAENDAEYAQRVWKTQVNQLAQDYAFQRNKLDSMNGKVIQGKDGMMYITGIKDNGDDTGTRFIKAYTPASDSTRGARVFNILEKLLGEDKAKSIMTTAMQTDDTGFATGKAILAIAKAKGKYEQLINYFDQGSDGKLRKALQETGMTLNTLQGGNDSAKKLSVDNARDALLIDFMLGHPQILKDAMNITGFMPDGGK